MNNIEFAQAYEDEIRSEFLNEAASDTENIFIQRVFDECFCFTPRQDNNHFIKIKAASTDDINGVSRKLANVKLNIPQLILLAVELTLETDKLETKFDFIKLGIKILLRSYQYIVKVELEKIECVLLCYLHEHNAYTTPVNEEQVFVDIQNGTLSLSRDSYLEAIRFLQNINAVYITGGHITLKEVVELSYR